MNNQKISQLLCEHYSNTFIKHGRNSKGVDWGDNKTGHLLRLEKMLNVIDVTSVSTACSILDVGCGYGSLLELIRQKKMPIKYTGVDISLPMINSAKSLHPNDEWKCIDILNDSCSGQYDYVVCNGILTQKLNVSHKLMDRYAHELIKKMFSLCRVGIAFNVMTTHVNFQVDNLYYRNPAELLAWCMSELSSKVRVDHSYPLFEYTIYLYRELDNKDKDCDMKCNLAISSV